MAFFDLMAAQQKRDRATQTQRENSGRLAFSIHKIESSGVGSRIATRAVMFDMPFVEEPAFSDGYVCTKRPPAPWLPPSGTATVHEWICNAKGHYTGARVTLAVAINSSDGSYSMTAPAVAGKHHLTFMGQAYKDLGSDVDADAQTIHPRTTSIWE